MNIFHSILILLFKFFPKIYLVLFPIFTYLKDTILSILSIHLKYK